MKRLRKVSMVVALAFFGFCITPAISALQPVSNVSTVMIDEEGKEIEFTALPKAVQDSFNEGEYAQWRVDKVYKMQKDNKTWFKLSVTDGNDSKDINYDENGQEVKEESQG